MHARAKPVVWKTQLWSSKDATSCDSAAYDGDVIRGRLCDQSRSHFFLRLLLRPTLRSVASDAPSRCLLFRKWRESRSIVCGCWTDCHCGNAHRVLAAPRSVVIEHRSRGVRLRRPRKHLRNCCLPTVARYAAIGCQSSASAHKTMFAVVLSSVARFSMSRDGTHIGVPPQEEANHQCQVRRETP